MKRLIPATAALLMAAALAQPGTASAAFDSADTNIAVDAATQLNMNVTANCVLAEGRCYFNTRASLMTPGGLIGFPGETWARQTITLRSSNRDVWQEAQYSAPSGTPPVVDRGANNGNVMSVMYKSLNNMEISVTYFGGGPVERFQTDGSSAPRDWTTGLPATGADFMVCSNIRVAYGGVNLAGPTACAQTTFS